MLWNVLELTGFRVRIVAGRCAQRNEYASFILWSYVFCEVFDSKERKSIEKYEKSICVCERPCRHARLMVYFYPS